MKTKQAQLKQKAKKSNRQVKFYYSFLTVVLLICFIQVTRSAILNITKTLNYNVKVRKMRVMKKEVDMQHERLQNDIKNFGNLKSLEAIARNNLKLAGEDEVLVIVNKENDKQPLSAPENDDENLTTDGQQVAQHKGSAFSKFQPKNKQ